MQNTATKTDAPQGRALYQQIGLALGPLIFVVMIVLGAGDTMDPMAWRTAAVGLWMAIWWATEAVPVPITAFIPIILFAPLGITTLGEATAPYARPIIFLFLGSFMLALSVQHWNLHKRIALMILSKIGTDGKKLVAGFMVTAALLSAFMTNTTTTMMLLPIALSVIVVVGENIPDMDDKARTNFQVALLLGLAYAASIGGLATIVGTPPNGILIGFLQDNYNYEISFANWMKIGVPVTTLMLPLTWIALTRWVYPVNIAESREVHDHLEKLRDELGPMTTPEKRIGLLFLAVIMLWIFRTPLNDAFPGLNLSDAGIAMGAALMLFVLPSGRREHPQLLTWQGAMKLPWGVLILFGGGLSLAGAVSGTGLAAYLGSALVPLGAFGVPVLVIASVALVIFLTELTSNIATTATFLPVLGAIAIEMGLDPLIVCLPITIAASCAFMLPVATPPNAIVYASNLISIPQMARAGLVLNIIGILLVTAISLWWAPAVLG